MPQFGDRLANVVQCHMLALFADTREHVRPPPTRQLFDGAYINAAIVEELLQPRHVAKQKAPILADAVTAQRGSPRQTMQVQKLQGLLLCRGRIDGTPAHTSDQAGRVVMFNVPVVHEGQRRLRLCNGEHGSFCKHVQFAVGDDARDLNDHVLIRVEPRHFQIDPNQIGRRSACRRNISGGRIGGGRVRNHDLGAAALREWGTRTA